MRYRNVLIFLGFVALIIQFLGFPNAWDRAFYAAVGILVMAFSYLAGKERKAPEAEQSSPVATSAEAQ